MKLVIRVVNNTLLEEKKGERGKKGEEGGKGGGQGKLKLRYKFYFCHIGSVCSVNLHAIGDCLG